MKKPAILLTLVLLVAGCSSDGNEQPEGKGWIEFGDIEIDDTFTTVETRASGPLTDFADYHVIIKDKDSGINTMSYPSDGVIRDVAVGEYNISLTSMTDDFKPAFGEVRYGATRKITVAGNQATSLSMMLERANTAVTFIYDDSLIEAGGEDIIPTVTQAGTTLSYERENQQAVGYFAPGDAEIKLLRDGEPVDISADIPGKVSFKAGQFWKITVKYDSVTGQIEIIVEIDDTIVTVDDMVVIDVPDSGVFTLTGLAGQHVDLTTVDDRTMKVELDVNGRTTIPLPIVGKVIKSITLSNQEVVYVGRPGFQDVSLKFVDGKLVLRDPVDGYIPVGTFSEMLLIDTDADRSKNYRQEADIDLMSIKWPLIVSFEGVYDGNGKSLANLLCSTSSGNDIGLFRTNYGTIRNLTIKSGLVEVEGRGCYVGALAGQNDGSKGKGVIENCVNHAEVKTMMGLGGITGNNINGAIIRESHNYGDITSLRWHAGGIAGYNDEGSVIERSVNRGEVRSIQRIMSDGIGGICGYITGPSRVSYCENYGKVVGTEGRVGGICGTISKGAATINNCVNYGEVVLDCSEEAFDDNGNLIAGIFSGGIIGDVTGSGLAAMAIVRDCVNYGNVTNIFALMAGGIAGSSLYAEIVNCENRGEVYTDLDGSGGIVAGRAVLSSFVNCKNYGAVQTDGSNAGGICGNVEYRGAVKITDCLNAGNISAAEKCAGGILGFVVESSSSYNEGSIDILRCKNEGRVTSDMFAGGVLGATVNYTNITAAYNTGSVSANSIVGGVFGYLNSGNSLSAGYNTGEVSGKDEVGAIGGNRDSRSFVKDCYWFVEDDQIAAYGFGDGGSMKFGDGTDGTGWPSASTSNWTTANWKSLGSWNSGNPQYPILIWE